MRVRKGGVEQSSGAVSYRYLTATLTGSYLSDSKTSRDCPHFENIRSPPFAGLQGAERPHSTGRRYRTFKKVLKYWAQQLNSQS